MIRIVCVPGLLGCQIGNECVRILGLVTVIGAPWTTAHLKLPFLSYFLQYPFH